MTSITLILISIGAGFLGALLGLGGGIVIVPTLTLLFNIDIKYAIAASLISIVATSSGAAAGFLKDHLTNLRLAVILEVGTVAGAITGFLSATYFSSKALFLIFGGFLLTQAFKMLKENKDNRALKNHPWSEKLNLNSSYEESNGEVVHYNIEKVPLGVFLMYIAGVMSALLGIGSGGLKVMAMDQAMKLPIKVSSATSNFMIGVTAASSAGAYLLKGDIKPEIVSPVAIGIIVGSYFGAKLMPTISPIIIKRIFLAVIAIASVQMLYKGFTL